MPVFVKYAAADCLICAHSKDLNRIRAVCKALFF